MACLSIRNVAVSWIASAVLVACGGGMGSPSDSGTMPANVDGAAAGDAAQGSDAARTNDDAPGTDSMQVPSDGGTTMGGVCMGDFTLGINPYHCDNCGLGQECNDSSSPTNCHDGTFITMGGHCYCIAQCSTFVNVGLGDACTNTGRWRCREIQATNASANHIRACVPDAWNLCQASPDSGVTATDAGPSCGAVGADCTQNGECCSNSCTSATCD